MSSNLLDGGAIPSLTTKQADNQKILGAPVSTAKSKTNVGKLLYLGAILVAALLMLVGFMTFSKYRAKKMEEVPKVEKSVDRTKEKNEALGSADIDKKKAEIKKKDALEKQQAETASEAAALAAAKANHTQPPANPAQPAAPGKTGQAEPVKPLTRNEQKLGGEVLFDGSPPSSGSQASGSAPRQTESAHARPPVGTDSQPSATKGQGDARLVPGVLEAHSAGRLGNLDYLLKKGTTVPCALRTGIDTTLPGFVICSVINDVYSANGKTLLIERGASIFGEQKSSISRGQARVFLLWTRVDNPSGVFAELDSPATDEMGYNGVPGYIDDHFFKRFGGAIMLSLIQDVIAGYVAKESGQGSNGPQYQNSTATTGTMATEALKNTINIPPTLTILPGKIVNVMVVRDVSFESVYQVVK
jgi:type IV secretion system protein VirB10